MLYGTARCAVRHISYPTTVVTSPVAEHTALCRTHRGGAVLQDRTPSCPMAILKTECKDEGSPCGNGFSLAPCQSPQVQCKGTIFLQHTARTPFVRLPWAQNVPHGEDRQPNIGHRYTTNGMILHTVELRAHAFDKKDVPLHTELRLNNHTHHETVS